MRVFLGDCWEEILNAVAFAKHPKPLSSSFAYFILRITTNFKNYILKYINTLVTGKLIVETSLFEEEQPGSVGLLLSKWEAFRFLSSLDGLDLQNSL